MKSQNNIAGIKNILSLFPNKYMVSEEGEVYIIATGKKLSKFLVKEYYKVFLNYRGLRKHVNIHRLVAQEYHPNPYDKKFINHKNGIKTDNRKDNVEWSTPSENVKHAHDTGLHSKPKGINNNMAKLTNSKVLKIFKSHKPVSELKVEYNISQQSIYAIRNGSLWAHITGKQYQRKFK